MGKKDNIFKGEGSESHPQEAEDISNNSIFKWNENKGYSLNTLNQHGMTHQPQDEKHYAIWYLRILKMFYILGFYWFYWPILFLSDSFITL